MLNKIKEYKDLLRLFYLTNSNALLVLHADRLFGLIFKDDVIRFSSDSNLKKKHISIVISFFIKNPKNLDISLQLKSYEELPAIDVSGKYLGYRKTKEFVEPEIQQLSQDILSYIMDVLHDPILVVDFNGNIIYYNETFKKFMGEEILGLEIERSSLQDKSHGLSLKVHYNEAIFLKYPLERENCIILIGKITKKTKRKEQKHHKYKSGKYTSISDYIESVEKEEITQAFKELNGNISRTAKILGIPRQTLQYKLSKYGLHQENTIKKKPLNTKKQKKDSTKDKTSKQTLKIKVSKNIDKQRQNVKKKNTKKISRKQTKNTKIRISDEDQLSLL